jgi:hypothetical protein
MGQTCEREVEFAVGFVGGRWKEVSITVEEPFERVMDDIEITTAATKIIEKIDFSPEVVSFYHVIYIEDPEGGFGEDLNI